LYLLFVKLLYFIYSCLLRTEIIFVRNKIFVVIFAELLPFFNCQTRSIPDTHPKPDGYKYRHEFLSVGMNIYMNFYS
jgi:hypothetical protein